MAKKSKTWYNHGWGCTVIIACCLFPPLFIVALIYYAAKLYK